MIGDDMAGTVRYTQLETRTARMRLKLGRAYWRSLVTGQLTLGYSRRSGSPGRWIVRTYLGGERYKQSTLGLADDISDADGSAILTFDEAVGAARASYKANNRDAIVSIVTVADALREYIDWLKVHRATGLDAERRANKLILPELGRIRLSDLTTERLDRWRNDLVKSPALLRTAKGAPQNFKPAPVTADEMRARRSSVNRIWTILRAALTKAFRDGHVRDDLAWRRIKKFENVETRREGFLSIGECRRLINACDPQFRPLAEGALLTGARYGELCALRVRDFAYNKIHVAHSKSGKPRHIVLSEEGVKFFDAFTAGRSPDAMMFEGWVRSRQSKPMYAACKRANIKPIGFQQLRHTWASHAVMNGMPLMVVARNLGHSSTLMVERHYGHLHDSYIDEEVRKAAPTFGIEAPQGNVKPIRR
jgi:integrase